MNLIRILFIGDVVGQKTCESLRKILSGFKRENKIDVVIINGENSADGNGITPASSEILLNAGADVITTGNHCYKRREMTPVFYDSRVIIRPANFGRQSVGRGWAFLDFGSFSVAVINLIGSTFMTPSDNPFTCAEKILSKIKVQTPNIIVDFHAEATSEKKAMGYFLSGKVSAVLGTHTHVQTADELILNEHTAYITDVGMTGVMDSVLGVEKSIIINRFTTYFPSKYILAEGERCMNAVIVDLNTETGATSAIERVQKII